MPGYHKARWWKLSGCGWKGELYGVKIVYGDWAGPTILIHDAARLLWNRRILRKERAWLRRNLIKQDLLSDRDRAASAFLER